MSYTSSVINQLCDDVEHVLSDGASDVDVIAVHVAVSSCEQAFLQASLQAFLQAFLRPMELLLVRSVTFPFSGGCLGSPHHNHSRRAEHKPGRGDALTCWHILVY